MYLLVNLIALLVIHSTIATNNATETSTQAPKVTSKTKRTIADLQTYGESKPILFLVDNVAAQSTNIPTFYTNPKALVLKPVFESDVPKQVAAQQVLYEFQQTPTNAVSNVHVNQLFQPFDFTKDAPTGPQAFSTEAPPTRQPYTRGNIPPTGPGQSIQTSESIANPVQHTALINHGQNYAHVQFQPSIPTVGTPQHIQTHHYIPGKYLYVNGKIIYQPTPAAQSSSNSQSPTSFGGPQNQQGQQNYHPQGHPHPQGPPHHPQGFNQNSLTNTAPQTYGHHGNPNHIQHINKRPPVNYITYHNNPRLPKQNLTPPPKPSVPPMHYSNSKFQPPSRLQQITKPMSSPAPVADREEEESEEEEKAPVKEEEEEVEEDDEEESPRSRYKDEEDEEDEHYYEERPGRYYERYRYNDDDDDEDDRQRYRKDEEEAEEEEDEDSHEGSSKVVPTKVKKYSKGKPSGKKHSKPYDKNKNYKYSESYGSKTEYETPSKHTRKSKGKSKSKSKPGYYKTVKYTKQANGKPKIETIEGRQSQLVPVIEKRKVFQESWVVSKSTDAGSA